MEMFVAECKRKNCLKTQRDIKNCMQHQSCGAMNERIIGIDKII